ncbi:lytic transglycosylase domain-containing protein [Desulfobacter hydrogenophilus]|uniref:lytic transglycosylase domain-containing protein n=1 Tax=Desulfobacter hydrogenophilus TaxID=2291 RepID=UPI001F5E4C2A|nr:lytic transglycosylase domain-containing protein [Desulfobacter hydrogenophilus]
MARFPGQLVSLSIFTLIIICVYATAGPVCRAAQPTALPEKSEFFPVYDLIKPNVTFWTNIFTKYTRGQALVHDMGNLSRIYEELKLNPAKSQEAALANKAIKKKAIEKYRAILLALSKGKIPETPLEKKVVALFPNKTEPVAFKLAANRLRVQTGLKEHFMEGVIRSGALIDEFKMIFRSYDLPEDLVYLPCLESAYDVQIYSKYGAAGLWQFTSYTGKLFMDINYVVDQRRDPIVSTHGAARLLKRNYEKLQNWPMAITAYNHGLYGMSRAKNKHKTYPSIYTEYSSRSFKFASRNFYPEFIAARQVAKNYVKYYGNITLDKPGQQTRYKVKNFLAARDLVRTLPVDLETLQVMNPALRKPVFDGRKYIPPGQILYLPKHISSDLLDKTLSPLYRTAQRATPFHRVVRGDTAGGIADAYKVPLKDLISLNSLGKKAIIHVDQTLKIPFKEKSQPQRTAVVPKPDALTQLKTKPYSEKQPNQIPLPPNQSKLPRLPQNLEVVTSDLELKTVHDEKGRKYAIFHATPEETITNYANWLGIDAGEIRKLNKMSSTQCVSAGHEVTIPLPASGAADFEEKRFEFQQEIIEDFFAAYFIAGTQTYTVAPEDTSWEICRKKLDIPFWLLQKYNPDIRINLSVAKGRILLYPLAEPRAKHPDGSKDLS